MLHDRLVETGILSEFAAMEEEVLPEVALGAVSDKGPPAVVATSESC